MTISETKDVILEAGNITKKFPGVVALDNVSFKIYRGKVNALVGENGAGKSTLMKIFAGVYQDYQGKIILTGKKITFSSTKQAQEEGIAIIYQEFNLVPNLSVAENVFLGREFLSPLGFIDYKRMCDETKKILNKLKLDINPKCSVSELRVGQQQIVEIAKALLLNAKILIMDEPTSAISEEEVSVLFQIIKTLTNQGVAVVYISHKLDELAQIADIVTVLRDGKVVGTHMFKEVSRDDIVRMMVGRQLKDISKKTASITEKEVLRIKNISLDHPTRQGDYTIDKISFDLKEGEVLGIFGLMGAGRTELLETIFGLHPRRSSGKIFIDGVEESIKSPKDAINAGIGFVTEDRKHQGLVLMMSVGFNISLANLKKFEKLFFLKHRPEKEMIIEYVNRLKIKTYSISQIVENLSGGNQQKAILAKWLATNPKILLLDEPTRGIDINAKHELYSLIDQLTKLGMGIILVSSELPEILGISDRIIVLSEGRKRAEFNRTEVNKELIMKAAIL